MLFKEVHFSKEIPEKSKLQMENTPQCREVRFAIFFPVDLILYGSNKSTRLKTGKSSVCIDMNFD